MSSVPPPSPPYQPYQVQAPQGHNPWPWIVGGGCGCLLVGLVLAIVACRWLGGMGMDLVASQIQADLADNPVILEHLGGIDSIEVDFTKTMSTGTENTVVLNVEGPKGSGVLIVESVTVDTDTEDVVSGTLEVGGVTYDLFPAGPE